MFSLTSQFKRAADSISLNIAEGSIGQTNPEQRKFIGYAIRSIAECVNCRHLSIKRSYISQDEFDKLYTEAERLFAKTTKFRNSIIDRWPLTAVYSQLSSVEKNTFFNPPLNSLLCIYDPA